MLVLTRVWKIQVACTHATVTRTGTSHKIPVLFQYHGDLKLLSFL